MLTALGAGLAAEPPDSTKAPSSAAPGAVSAPGAMQTPPAVPKTLPPLPAPSAADSASGVEPWNIESNSTNAVRGVDGLRVFSFEGEVVITHGALIATSDAARYFEGPARALLSGNVVMEQDSLIAHGPSAVYERTTRIATFPEGIVIESPTGTAVADRGIWTRDHGLFELTGNAAAADTAGTIEAQSLFYDTRNDVFRATGEGKFVDEASGVTVTGGMLEYDRRAGRARAGSEPVAEFLEQDAETPIRVFARALDYDPRNDVAVATHDVRILRESVEAFADSATFLRREERAVLTGSPRVVDGTTEITGDRIELVDEAPGRRRVLVTGAARVANRFRPDSTAVPLPGGSLSDSAGAAPDSAAAAPDSAAVAARTRPERRPTFRRPPTLRGSRSTRTCVPIRRRHRPIFFLPGSRFRAIDFPRRISSSAIAW